ncbi:alpha/beta hydrolase-fold protein [Aquibacillus sp. 3ASR75-11]|uniref:Alpha/beta hydrolase-fold protein n=1 Tax=Terrihalobacillus insolitus TaxID=2950438 RepID=A0A9X3WT44_9BACI|nr:alpha/beta hydrolase-fold protein [Terrihalobacillus insolitus]MDC3425472.1 alpha/beta hydrolase-fold protein [Terrihalobacillus insolitus]
MRRKGTMKEKEIESAYLQERITIRWYEPESFSDLYKYHICIMQDGNDYYQLGRVATFSDQLHQEDEIHHTVFVGIHYKDRYDRKDKYHPDGVKQSNYMHFLVKEVVPFLDDVLPTYQVGGSRALMGDSLGGTVALMTALKYPNTFGKVIMQSPYVDDKVLASVENANPIYSLDIYHTIGTEETEVETTGGNIQDFLAPNRTLHELLIQHHQFDYRYHELEGNHTWKFWQKDLKRALSTMFG